MIMRKFGNLLIALSLLLIALPGQSLVRFKNGGLQYKAERIAPKAMLSGSEATLGKHVASDYHIHAFNHNEGDKAIVAGRTKVQDDFGDGKFRNILSHMTRRTREGGFDCSFHSFSEHIGFSSVNKANMFKKIDKLNDSIKASNEGLTLNVFANNTVKALSIPGKKKAKNRKINEIADLIWDDAGNGFKKFKSNDLAALNILLAGLAPENVEITDDFKELVRAEFERTHLIDDECSYFSVGLEFTPGARPKPLNKVPSAMTSKLNRENFDAGHVLMLFADQPRTNKTSLKQLYDSLDSSLVASQIERSNQDALLAFAHPTRPKQIWPLAPINSDLNNAKTIEHFKEFVLSNSYGIRDNISQNVKDRFVGVEFPRLAGKELVNDNLELRAKFGEEFNANEKLYKSLLALGYNVAPMVGGDRHNAGVQGKGNKRRFDTNVNLTILGPEKAIKDKTELNTLGDSSDPTINLYSGKNFRPALMGFTNTILINSDINSKITSGSFYKAVKDRRLYASYKRNLQLTTLTKSTKSVANAKHMGSKLNFDDVDSITVTLSDAADPLIIDEDKVPEECVPNLYKVRAIFSNDANPADDAEISTWSEKVDLPPSSACSSTFNLTLTDEMKASPFIYFKVIAKDGNNLRDTVIATQESKSRDELNDNFPAAISSAYLNTKARPTRLANGVLQLVGNGLYPVLNENYVAWLGFSEDRTISVHLYELSEEEDRILDSTKNDAIFSLAMSDNHFSWVKSKIDNESGALINSKIKIYDLEDSSIIKELDQGGVSRANGSLIAYDKHVSTNSTAIDTSNIFFYNLQSQNGSSLASEQGLSFSSAAFNVDKNEVILAQTNSGLDASFRNDKIQIFNTNTSVLETIVEPEGLESEFPLSRLLDRDYIDKDGKDIAWLDLRESIDEVIYFNRETRQKQTLFSFNKSESEKGFSRMSGITIAEGFISWSFSNKLYIHQIETGKEIVIDVPNGREILGGPRALGQNLTFDAGFDVYLLKGIEAYFNKTISQE